MGIQGMYGYTWVNRVYRVNRLYMGIQGIHGYTGYAGCTWVYMRNRSFFSANTWGPGENVL